MENVKFTTKSAIIDGIRYKAAYKLNDDKSLEITIRAENEQTVTFTLYKGEKNYAEALAKFEEKEAKRAAGKIDLETVKGMQLDGGYFKIKYQSDIDRCIVVFKKKPAPEVREIVKAYGFWWTPTHKCWSRKLNPGAWFAGQELYKKLTA